MSVFHWDVNFVSDNKGEYTQSLSIPSEFVLSKCSICGCKPCICDIIINPNDSDLTQILDKREKDYEFV
jgi:hypothetical protein